MKSCAFKSFLEIDVLQGKEWSETVVNIFDTSQHGTIRIARMKKAKMSFDRSSFSRV